MIWEDSSCLLMVRWWREEAADPLKYTWSMWLHRLDLAGTLTLQYYLHVGMLQQT